MTSTLIKSGQTNLSPASTAEASSSNPSQLVTLNVNSQLPIKLSSNNYPSSRAQFNSLLLGHNLFGNVDGSFSRPPKTIMVEGSSTLQPNLDYVHWFQQDQLLLHGIIASTSECVVPFLAACTSSFQV